MRNKNLFLGLEAEGPKQNDIVLFVPNSCSSSHFSKTFKALPSYIKKEIKGVYIGSGDDLYAENIKLLKTILSLTVAFEYFLTIELFYSSEIKKIKTNIKTNKNLFFVVRDKKNKENALDIYTKKITQKKIIWTNTKTQKKYITKKQDIRFYFDTPCDELKKKQIK